ncbi:hypothetical protein [Duganella violaceipulchra]|uniref:Uncharacterized protein n=1 Tax=Duganella violaceipulchra TaxID=2849652 RepID=A0AA41L3K4_9BURK|nr:hypothetical protein [Duganella violaceicalia]MBV6324058.1 hypothetical protein [Duganella violaceicalia]MCP2010959.1 hypothetical protein [Duganella violaceicalia]
MQRRPKAHVKHAAVPIAQTASADIAAKLEARKNAIAAAFGILKGKGVFPEDGLDYQLDIRAEQD